MICPECGKETSNEQAFCRLCGAFVRSQFGKVLPTGPLRPIRAANTGPLVRIEKDSLGDLDWAEIEALLLADEDDWPDEDESVFIPNDQVVDDVQPEIAATEFEDAQADDLVEQSLSGQIKREDLVAQLEQLEPVREPSIHETKLIDVAPVSQTLPSPDDQFLKTNPEMFVGIEPATVEVPPPPSSKRWLAAAALVLVPIAFFAGGIFVGVRASEYLKIATTPEQTAVPPVTDETPGPQPPKGMAFVPGGDFLMGSDDGDIISKPPHFVTVAPFFMDVTEVTNQEYAEFVTATGQVAPASWKHGVYPEAEATFPVTGITWYEAAEYAAWKGKRLPTEAEWEFAARGPELRKYPWGDEWDPTLANAGGESTGLRPVGQGGVSQFGIYDMSGNAWEWTSSDARSYPAGKEFPASRLRLKIIRGGNWQSTERSATTYFRGFYGAAGEKEYNGTSFRCVKDLPK